MNSQEENDMNCGKIDVTKFKVNFTGILPKADEDEQTVREIILKLETLADLYGYDTKVVLNTDGSLMGHIEFDLEDVKDGKPTLIFVS